MSSSEAFFLSAFFKRFRDSLKAHHRVLFYDLDTVKDASIYRVTKNQLLDANKNGKSEALCRAFNRQYLFPYLVILYVFLDCAAMFAANNWRYVIDGMPRMFFHLVWPVEFWEYSDIMMAFAIGMCLLMYPLILTDPMLDPTYFMYLFADCKDKNSVKIITQGIVLEQSVAQVIASKRKRIRSFMPLMMVSIYLTIESFFFWYFYHNWQNTPHDYVMFACILLFFFYLCISNLFMLYYFSLAILYIKIKQKFCFTKLLKLTCQIKEIQAKVRNPRMKSRICNWQFWRQLQVVNGQILRLYREIRAQNTFWCKYLTVYFVVYIIEICYLSYVFFYFEDTSGRLSWQRLFCLACALDFALIILYVTLECSLFVNKNSQMHRTGQRVALQLQTISQLKLVSLLKIEQRAANYRNIPDISFKLLNNYNINSQMFQLIFTYTSFFFMMIVQKKSKNIQEIE